MSALLVGYARCSTDQQDLTAQRSALLGLGVEAERIYVDHDVTFSADGTRDVTIQENAAFSWRNEVFVATSSRTVYQVSVREGVSGEDRDMRDRGQRQEGREFS